MTRINQPKQVKQVKPRRKRTSIISMEGNRRRQERWRKLNPDKARALQINKKEKVTIGYAASCFGTRISSVPIEMLEAKTMIIRINRKLKESKNG